jgi:hypothetical protein
MPGTNTDTAGEPPVIATAREELGSYARLGASYSPASIAFDLIALDQHGSCTGAGATVCRDCVSKVAANALAYMSGAPLPWDPTTGTWKAVVQCGSALAYGLPGASELAYDAFCAECERLITGNHVHNCNGRSYIAGVREGLPCRCPDLVRFQRVAAGAGVTQFEDPHGDRFVERLARAARTCDACEQPIANGKLYYAQVARSAWTRCCRCTQAY